MTLGTMAMDVNYITEGTDLLSAWGVSMGFCGSMLVIPESGGRCSISMEIQ